MKILNELMFRLLVVFHFIMLVGNILAPPFLLLLTPWYVSIPLVSFLVNLIFNAAFKTCPLTTAENLLRSRTGRRPIRGFVGHYILLPLRKMKRKIQ